MDFWMQFDLVFQGVSMRAVQEYSPKTAAEKINQSAPKRRLAC